MSTRRNIPWLSRNDAVAFRVERATCPFRWATSPPVLLPEVPLNSEFCCHARLGGKLPPSTARLAVPPISTACLRLWRLWLALWVFLVLLSSTGWSFNFDGQTDLVWQHRPSGETAVWFMDGANFVSAGWIKNDAGIGWRMVATADFNGDGQTDLLWRNPATGENGIWLMNGTNRIVGQSIAAGALEYDVVGTGDFDGDGSADILWRHKTNDLTAVWFMKGTNWSGQVGWLPRRAGPEWRAEATGDFNQDGQVDVVWRHQSNGRNAIWLLHGTNLAKSVEIRAEPDLENRLVGAGTFNGIGQTDLLWRHRQGTNVIWLMSGTDVIGSAHLPAQSDSNWEIVGTGGYRASAGLSVRGSDSTEGVVLNWRSDSIDPPPLQRKTPNSTTWSRLSVSPSRGRWIDTNVVAGRRYEYRSGTQYWLTGMQAAPVEDRGRVILVVEKSMAAALKNELRQFRANLVGDGWSLVQTNVPRHDDTRWTANTNQIAALKAFLTACYQADPAQTKTVVLIGHVPIPYSGYQNPDGHGARALPADGFYGDIDGVYTDTRLDSSSSIDPPEPRHDNRVGDGKWDQNRFSSELEMAVGRIDFANLPVFSEKREIDLLRQYLDKDDRYRHKKLVFPDRVVVGNFLPMPEAKRHLYTQARDLNSRLFGPEAGRLVEGDLFEPSQAALWGFLGGWGLPYRVQGARGFHTAQDLTVRGKQPRVLFACLYGSYFVDWAYPNNLMRASLGASDSGLAAMWLLCHAPGSVQLAMETLALGDPLGDGFLRTVNRNLQSGGGSIYLSLLGDPTLRLQILAPPARLSADGRSAITLRWVASEETGQHFVYRSNGGMEGPWERLTPKPLTANSYVDPAPLPGSNLYQIRAVRLTSTGSGSFTNLSQGIFVQVNRRVESRRKVQPE